MRNYIEKHPFFTSFFIQLIILSCYIISGTMKYEVSDDFMMQLMVSGAYGTAASDMMFTSPLLAMGLSWFYQIIPVVNWYFYFQVLLILISLSIIGFVFMKEKYHPLIQSFVFAFLLFIAKDFYQLMQFTKTATIVLCAASILAIYAMKQKKRFLIPAIVLLAIGVMLRRKCIYMAGTPLAVYVLFDLIEHRTDLWNALKPYLLLGICAGICYVGVISSSSFIENSQSDLVAYDKFNTARVAINDVKAIPYEEIKAELDQIGVSENDYQMMLSWNFGDEDFFTTETMSKVADIMDEHQNHSIKDALYSMVYRKYWTYVIFWMILISVIVCAIFFESISQAIVMGIAGISLLLLNAYVSRNVYRVEVSTFIACALFYLYSIKKERKNISAIWSMFPAGCMMIVSVLGMMPIHAQSNYDTMNASWDNNLSKYQVSFKETPLAIIQEMEAHPDNTYILGFQSCIQSFYLHYDPIVDYGASLLDNAIYLGGVDFNHPLRNKWMNQHQLNNTLQSLLQEDVYLVEHKTQQQILTYLQEHVDENITMELVKEIDGYQIWKYHK